LLFGLHPALVEAVAGISNREDVLAAFFGLAALLAVRRVLEGELRALALVTAAYAVALLSKESALAVPLLAGVLALCSPRFRPRGRPRRVWLGLALAFGVVTLGWAAFQLRLGYPSLLPAAGGSGLERASMAAPLPGLRSIVAWQARAAPSEPETRARARRRPQGEISVADAPALEAWRAWQLMVAWPTAPEYDLAPFRAPWARVLGSVALALLAAAMVRDLRRRGRFALGIAWFFAASVPVVVPTLLLNPLADRYLYLPAVGAALTLAWLIAERLPEAASRPELAGPLMLGTGVACFALTSTNMMRFHDDVALFTAATQSAPRSARAQQNLGSALLTKERVAEAALCLGKAVELDPTLLAARVNLGLLEEVRGNPNAAREHYRLAVELPRVVAEQKLAARACERLGSLLVRSGRRSEAEELLARERARGLGTPCVEALERSVAAP
jgi:tetratricopeptide (TPR) repeat protein